AVVAASEQQEERGGEQARGNTHACEGKPSPGFRTPRPPRTGPDPDPDLVQARALLHTPAVPGHDAARASVLLADIDPLLPRLASPALLIDLDAVDRNIAAVLRRCPAERWRPHIKTLKAAALIERLWAAGVHRCKCATL